MWPALRRKEGSKHAEPCRLRCVAAHNPRAPRDEQTPLEYGKLEGSGSNSELYWKNDIFAVKCPLETPGPTLSYAQAELVGVQGRAALGLAILPEAVWAEAPFCT